MRCHLIGTTVRAPPPMQRCGRCNRATGADCRSLRESTRHRLRLRSLGAYAKAVRPDGSPSGVRHEHMVGRKAIRKKLYLGLGAFWFVASNAKSVGDSCQIGERPSPHFSHDMAAMDLHCDLADTQFLRNQLV